jgi:hypothetical protein
MNSNYGQSSEYHSLNMDASLEDGRDRAREIMAREREFWRDGLYIMFPNDGERQKALRVIDEQRQNNPDLEQLLHYGSDPERPSDGLYLEFFRRPDKGDALDKMLKLFAGLGVRTTGEWYEAVDGQLVGSNRPAQEPTLITRPRRQSSGAEGVPEQEFKKAA